MLGRLGKVSPVRLGCHVMQGSSMLRYVSSTLGMLCHVRTCKVRLRQVRPGLDRFGLIMPG